MNLSLKQDFNMLKKNIDKNRYEDIMQKIERQIDQLENINNYYKEMNKDRENEINILKNMYSCCEEMNKKI